MIYNNNYDYENDNTTINNDLNNNHIKKYICNLCKNQVLILKKKSIYSNGEFICLNCWDRFYKILNKI